VFIFKQVQHKGKEAEGNRLSLQHTKSLPGK